MVRGYAAFGECLKSCVVGLAGSLALVLEKSGVAAVRAMLVVDQNDTPVGELMESARKVFFSMMRAPQQRRIPLSTLPLKGMGVSKPIN